MKTSAAKLKTGAHEKQLSESAAARAASLTLGRRPARKASTVQPLQPQGGGGTEIPRAELVRLDPVIHERTRLSILTALFTTADPGCSFSDLRDTLALTDGNLMTHLRTLEDAGLVDLLKEGAGRNSSTTIQLSNSGRRSFHTYLDQLESLVRTARGK